MEMIMDEEEKELSSAPKDTKDKPEKLIEKDKKENVVTNKEKPEGDYLSLHVMFLIYLPHSPKYLVGNT